MANELIIKLKAQAELDQLKQYTELAEEALKKGQSLEQLPPLKIGQGFQDTIKQLQELIATIKQLKDEASKPIQIQIPPTAPLPKDTFGNTIEKPQAPITVTDASGHGTPI